MSVFTRFLRRAPVFCVSGKKGLFVFFLLLLLFPVSCEFWEDWCDGDTPPHTAKTAYTRDEAMSLVCNKLIMKFSMMSEKPSISCRASDDMARGVASLLRKANAIELSFSGPGNVCSLESAPSESGFWHPVVMQVSTGKVLLDEIIPLAPEGNSAL